jgi:hypothetical protein
MPIKIEVTHSAPATKSNQLEVAECVRDEFTDLPPERLLIFLDNEDAECFREKWGPMNRGFFTSLNGGVLLTLGIPLDKWPERITRHFLARDPETGKYILDPETGGIKFVYDQVIYLYGTTCDDSVGRVMTLAHELQHFVQYGFHRELHKKNFEFLRRLPAYEIPIEKEARIIAKRIAEKEKLCGTEQVANYIARKISDADDHINSGANSVGALEENEIKQWQDEAKDWRFIQELDSSIPYDLATETELVRHRLAEH